MGPQKSGQGKDVLAMGYRRQDVVLDPVTVDQHPLLMAAQAGGAKRSGTVGSSVGSWVD